MSGKGRMFDSRPDTYAHIAEVRGLLLNVAVDLIRRAHVHDASKLEDPERAVFDEFTPKLRETTYGSDKYQEYLAAMGAGLRHHYEMNRHHPEHFPKGIADMTLIDLIEMLCDWQAATKRHADGDIHRSIEQNAERFGYGEELKQLFLNTVGPKKRARLHGAETETSR